MSPPGWSCRTGHIEVLPNFEPASKTDMMALAASVAELEERWQMLTTRVTGVDAILDRLDGW